MVGDDYRKQIDDIDGQIADLFARRMEIVRQIAARKKERSLSILDAAREQEILERLAARVPEKLRDDLRRVYAQMLAVSREFQARVMDEDSGDGEEG